MADTYTHTLRGTEARIYDETASTALYARIHFIDGTLSYSLRRPRSEEKVILNQGKADALIHSNIVTDQPTYEPMDLSISALLHADKTIADTLVAMNPFDATWTPGGTSTFVTVTAMGTADNAEGTAITLPLPADSHRAAYLTILEVLLDPGSTTKHMTQFAGVFWEQVNLEVSEGTGTLTAEAKVYGAITAGTAFTAGTEIT